MTKAAGPRPVKPWRRPRLSVDERIYAPLAAITIEEKVAQPDSHWVFDHQWEGPASPVAAAATSPPNSQNGVPDE
jgi:hypothetical protein